MKNYETNRFSDKNIIEKLKKIKIILSCVYFQNK